ncbi:extracellular gdsl-like lipase [Moniliophthora roreri]|nr:extracellular gdsl-like lipase [Moniliophthora roreri]
MMIRHDLYSARNSVRLAFTERNLVNTTSKDLSVRKRLKSGCGCAKKRLEREVPPFNFLRHGYPCRYPLTRGGFGDLSEGGCGEAQKASPDRDLLHSGNLLWVRACGSEKKGKTKEDAKDRLYILQDAKRCCHSNARQKGVRLLHWALAKSLVGDSTGLEQD